MKHKYIVTLILILCVGLACSLGNSEIDEAAVSTTDEPTITSTAVDDTLPTAEPTETATSLPPPPTETVEATVEIQATNTPMPEETDKIAFSFSDGDDFDIYVVNVDGSNLTQVTDTPTDDLYPVWSPDGQKITYIAEQDANSKIYVMNIDGNSRAHVADGTEFAWSPDSQQIAVVSEQNGQGEIFLVKVDGSDSTYLVNGYAPSWSPDGQKIAYQTRHDTTSEIYIINADGSNPEHIIDPAGNPVWSPDGSKIAFTSYIARPSQVYVVNVNGDNLTRLTDGSEPAWSPDGNQLAFVKRDDVRQKSYALINADGSGETTIIDGIPNQWNGPPAWTPDGQQITLISGRMGLGVDVIKPDGSSPTRLVDELNGIYAFPAWSQKLPLTNGATDTLPTPTPSAVLTSTPKPIVVVPTPTLIPVCPSPGVQITSPAPDTHFTERYNQIIGTANIDNLRDWKIEYSTNPNGSWNFLLQQNHVANNDELFMLDASTVPNGPYGVRLTVVDQTGNYPTPCEVWFVNDY